MNFWDRTAGIYDIVEALNSKPYRAMLEGVRQVVPRGAAVLDCAAGTGELSIAAAEKAEYVVCTDLSLPMLEKAKKKCAKRLIDNVRFEERDIMSLSDPDDTYDAVIAGNVLHLLDDPKAAVRELCRVAKNGGKLILPTFLNIKPSAAVKLYKLVGFRPASDYSAESYRKMLEECGCGRVKLTVLNGRTPVGFGIVKVCKTYD